MQQRWKEVFPEWIQGLSVLLEAAGSKEGKETLVEREVKDENKVFLYGPGCGSARCDWIEGF